MRRGTGRHRRESLLERMEAGMDGYVSKPIKSELLATEIERCTAASEPLTRTA